MKKIVFHLLTLLLLINCTNAQKKETTIVGRVIGEIPKEIQYTIPLNGTFSRNFNQTLKPSINGEFLIKINLDSPSFIEILVANKLAKSFVVEAGKEYELILDFTAETIKEQFKLSQNGERLLYQNFPLAGSVRGAISKIEISKNVADINKEILSQKNKSMKLFNNLLSSNKIDQKLFDFIQMNNDVYYSALIASIVTARFMKTNPNDFDKFPLETKQFWKSIFNKHELTESKYLKSPFWTEYAKSYNDFKEYTHEDFGIEKITAIRQMASEGKIHSYFLKKAENNLPEFSLEFYFANYIIEELNKKRYEKELIYLFNDFKAKYPTSKYIDYLEPGIEKVKKFHKIVDDKSINRISFLDQYEKINTIKEVLELFKGKRVYIDVWATWCGPCKEEFKHKKQLSKLLKTNNIEILYISIDEEKRDEQWKKMIEFYNLEGKHLRANKELTKDLQRLFNDDGKISIPWYLLVDEQGNIIKNKAQRPSQLKALEKEINTVFKN